jgi:hypothetical protein
MRVAVPILAIVVVFISFVVLVRAYQARDRRQHELELQDRRDRWADRMLEDDDE